MVIRTPYIPLYLEYIPVFGLLSYSVSSGLLHRRPGSPRRSQVRIESVGMRADRRGSFRGHVPDMASELRGFHFRNGWGQFQLVLLDGVLRQNALHDLINFFGEAQQITSGIKQQRVNVHASTFRSSRLWLCPTSEIAGFECEPRPSPRSRSPAWRG